MENEKRMIDANKARVVAQRIYSDPVLVHAILNTLNNTPTVDAVEEVRCEKCEHWEKVYGGQFCRQFGYCNECKMDTPSDHFCSYGERREGE